MSIERSAFQLDFGPTLEAAHTDELLGAIDARASNRSSSIHGPTHWTRVHEFGKELARSTPGADATVVALFALFHDTMRENDGHDPEHGPRAAALAIDLATLLRIDAARLKLLAAACSDHDRGRTTAEPTIGSCWDADRLDLPRVGITPDPHLFSTQVGKARAASIAAEFI
jgi:uncharacterized protein